MRSGPRMLVVSGNPSRVSEMDYENANGLVDGNIPAGKACPFLSECNFKEHRLARCPTTEAPKQVDYSCAAARLFSLTKKR